MHARIAGALQLEARDAADLPPERMVEIARHLTLAETVVGANAAVPYLLAVADDARARSAFQLAENALRTALELSARIASPAERRTTQTAIATRLTLQSLIVADPRQILSETASGDSEPAAFSHPNADPLVWWGGQAHRMAVGQADQALTAAEGVIAEDLTGAAEAVAHLVAGLACFVLGRLEPAERHLALADELSAVLPGEQPPWILTTLVASPATRSGIAVLRSDWVTAAEHLARARTRAGELTSELVLVEYYAAWDAAQRGQPQLAVQHASRCEKLGEQLGDSYWGPMSRVLLGWGRSMLGDARGVQVIKDAYAHCEAVGLRFHAIVHLMLCAEAHARHGAMDQARAFLRDSRAALVDHEDELLGPRLKRVANDLEPPTV
jgi:hypothetical protein